MLALRPLPGARTGAHGGVLVRDQSDFDLLVEFIALVLADKEMSRFTGPKSKRKQI